MVKNFFNIFYKKIDGLHEAAYFLGIFAILSQVLALLRDRVLASSFGVGHTLGFLLITSFSIPDFIFATVGSIVSISVLVPFITYRLERSTEETKYFINTIFSFFSLLIVGASILGFIFMPILAPRIFPGIADKTTLIHMASNLFFADIPRYFKFSGKHNAGRKKISRLCPEPARIYISESSSVRFFSIRYSASTASHMALFWHHNASFHSIAIRIQERAFQGVAVSFRLATD